MFSNNCRLPSMCWWLLQLLVLVGCQAEVGKVGVNWGTQFSHPLHPPDVVKMLLENSVARVKLFETERSIMKALAGSNLEVMVGIPNHMLEILAMSTSAAEDWVRVNVSQYLKRRNLVDIRHVAVGDEPIENGISENIVLRAVLNIQNALNNRVRRRVIKVTVPFSATVVQSDTYAPSKGRFSSGNTRVILQALYNFGSPFTVNIYPYFSKLKDPFFPLEFAFFDNTFPFINDGSLQYTNALDSTYDTVVAALENAGFPDMPIIVGETGWPTDCDPIANLDIAGRYMQGLVKRILSSHGTPRRPQVALHAYIFGLIDEDMKDITPGNFERHWGMFYYDGTPKYDLDMSGGLGANVRGLMRVPGVEYLPARWCVYDVNKDASDGVLVSRISIACENADCTSLGNGGSCSFLTIEEKTSYAFNTKYQLHDQAAESCDLDYGTFVRRDPSPSSGYCKFTRQIRVISGAAVSSRVRVFSLLVLCRLLLV